MRTVSAERRRNLSICLQDQLLSSRAGLALDVPTLEGLSVQTYRKSADNVTRRRTVRVRADDAMGWIMPSN
ncbi:protein of unknown function [Nitrospira japonica]|uniref:Uncharacterized protein n=1 Tax=Nitrospira japonica TaxID=1325564 RepID=A0A1W1I176_9BACT|nr:protein of unknown function [Nitrospira japonica]